MTEVKRQLTPVSSIGDVSVCNRPDILAGAKELISNRELIARFCHDTTSSAINRLHKRVAEVGIAKSVIDGCPTRYPSKKGLATNAQAVAELLSLIIGVREFSINLNRKHVRKDNRGNEITQYGLAVRTSELVDAITLPFEAGEIFRKSGINYTTSEAIRQLSNMTIKIASAALDVNNSRIFRVIHYESDAFAFDCLASNATVKCGKFVPGNSPISFAVRSITAPYYGFDVEVESRYRCFYDLRAKELYDELLQATCLAYWESE